MRSLPTRFATSCVLLAWEDFLISLPEIGVAMCLPINWRYLLPELAASGGAAVANDQGDDLPRLTAQRHPDPTFMALLEHE